MLLRRRVFQFPDQYHPVFVLLFFALLPLLSFPHFMMLG
jgi:hypothetical protein